ncbi:hypothetical protein [Intestinimonas butyriciproducens]|nr:hypothetical protein [Intestinimonas butyriciproducens]
MEEIRAQFKAAAENKQKGKGPRRLPRPLPFEKEGGIWFAEV